MTPALATTENSGGRADSRIISAHDMWGAKEEENTVSMIPLNSHLYSLKTFLVSLKRILLGGLGKRAFVRIPMTIIGAEIADEQSPRFETQWKLEQKKPDRTRPRRTFPRNMFFFLNRRLDQQVS